MGGIPCSPVAKIPSSHTGGLDSIPGQETGSNMLQIKTWHSQVNK